MNIKNRFWFLRFLEGTEGASAGDGGASNGDSSESSNSDDKKSDDSKTDFEARIKELEAERDTWKKHARTWEDRAKSGDAGDSVKQIEEQLAELKEATAQREADLKARERKALIATIAAEEGVTKDDVQYLPDSDDEEVVRKFAKRLASGGRGAESNNFGGSTGASKEAVINRVKNL